MPFTGYTSTARIIRILDEEYLGTLASRGKSKTWNKKHVDEVIRLCSAKFEAHAINKYTLSELRTDPPPDFAVKLITDLVLFEFYKFNKRHVVPKALQLAYKDAEETLKSWGNAQIIDADGESLLADARITYTTTEDDLEFPYWYIRDWY